MANLEVSTMWLPQQNANGFLFSLDFGLLQKTSVANKSLCY